MSSIRSLICAIAALLTVAACTMAAEPACACIKLMPEHELAALIDKAENGDVKANGEVWLEYWLRGDTTKMESWRSRVIAAGSAPALWKMSLDANGAIGETKSGKHRSALISEASTLLELANSNRAQIKDDRWTNETGFAGQYGSSPISWDNQADFARDLRQIRALAAVERQGFQYWLDLARGGDAIAAYHVSEWYGLAENEHGKSEFWRNRASQLGDPSFAGLGGESISEQTFLDIELALNQTALWDRVGDHWIQERLRRALETRYSNFAIRYNKEHREKPVPTKPRAK